MKFFKSSILLASAVAMSFSFAACDESTLDDFATSPSTGSSSEGLYFPSTNPTTIEVAKTDNAFSIPVDRFGLTDAATYAISITGDTPEGAFTFPNSVSFAEGQTSSSIIVNCNLAEVPSNSSFKINVEFAQGVPTYMNGVVNGTYTITIPASWGAWKPYDKGICTWFYDLGFLMSGADPELPIYIRDNTEDANLAQFRIDHWRQNVTLTMEWDRTTNYIRIPFDTPTNVQVNVSDVGALDEYVTDVYTYQATIGEDASEFIDSSVYDEETGTFNIFVVYYVYNPATGKPALLNGSYGYERCIVGDYKDYSVAFKYEGVFTSVSTESFAQFVTNVGSDAENAKLMISNTMSAQEILAAIQAGDESAVSVATGEQNVRVPVSEGGEYIAVLASFANGEVQNASAVKFNVLLGGGDTENADWQDYSTGLIQDGWFTAAFTFTAKDGSEVTYEELPWEFTVQKHKTEPGLYRLKNVYLAPTSVLNELEINENEAPYSIIIDCSNPEVVKIQPQASGFATSRSSFGFSAENNYMGYMGNMAGFAVAQAGWTDEQIIAKGWNDSYLEDGIVVVESCKFGADANENFGYAWNSKPVGMIALEDLSAGAPAKMLENKLNLRAKAKVAGMLRPIRHNMDLKSAPIVINKKGIDKSMVLKVK